MTSDEIRRDFSVLMNNDIAYLDSGATSQKPKCVIDSETKYYETINSNPHRGAYSLSIEATKAYEDAREKVARFINAENPYQIIFSKNATECLNLVAYSYGLNNVKENDEIILSIMEHHSNLVPWQFVTKNKNAKLNYLYIDENYEIKDEEIENKITNNTKIVGITYVSNVTGTINNVRKIIDYAHSKGAVVILDASQAISHIKIDVQELDADFLIFSGHKMYAPMGVGVLYGKKELLNKMNPFLMGGDMIEYVYEQDTTFAPLPQKYEAGTQNVGAAIGLSKAIDYMESIGYDTIQSIEKDLRDYAVQELKKLDFIELYLTPNLENHSSVISFNIKGVHPHDVASILDMNGVCIRSGNHCAQPLMRYLDIDSTCRISFAIYNTHEDIDRLIKALIQTYEKFKQYIK